MPNVSRHIVFPSSSGAYQATFIASRPRLRSTMEQARRTLISHGVLSDGRLLEHFGVFSGIHARSPPFALRERWSKTVMLSSRASLPVVNAACRFR
jgi:hypothetical protein